jgi:hypothetical protein
LGYNPTASSMTSAQLAIATDRLNDALRRFYEPDILPGEREKHQWSFLLPTARFQFVENEFKVDLPADFSMLNGPITYARGEDTVYPPIAIVGPQEIYKRQQQDDSAGRPQLAAVQVKAVDPVAGTRHELLLYPTSDDDYEVNLSYKVNPYSLDFDTALPLGGQAHVQTIIAACLAECAAFDELSDGQDEMRYIERLRSSISHDRRVFAPETLGINYDTSDAFDIYADGPLPVRLGSWGNVTTYGGVVPGG